MIDPDKVYDPNKYNDDYGLNRETIPWGVTHINFYAHGFGQIAEEDVDALSGNQVFKFHLVSTTVKPKPRGPIAAFFNLC